MCTNPLLPFEYASDISSMFTGIETNTTFVAEQLEDMIRSARLGVDPWTGCNYDSRHRPRMRSSLEAANLYLMKPPSGKAAGDLDGQETK